MQVIGEAATNMTGWRYKPVVITSEKKVAIKKAPTVPSELQYDLTDHLHRKTFAAGAGTAGIGVIKIEPFTVEAF